VEKKKIGEITEMHAGLGVGKQPENLEKIESSRSTDEGVVAARRSRSGEEVVVTARGNQSGIEWARITSRRNAYQVGLHLIIRAITFLKIGIFSPNFPESRNSHRLLSRK
jgi:hypothetical protein